MDVGHRQRGLDDPGQARDFRQLLEAAIALDLLEQPLVCEHARGHPHPAPWISRELPGDVADAAQPPGVDRARVDGRCCGCCHDMRGGAAGGATAPRGAAGQAAVGVITLRAAASFSGSGTVTSSTPSRVIASMPSASTSGGSAIERRNAP